MGSVGWARGSWSAAGSLWGWAASRLHLDWTPRFLPEDEEMLVLTQSDELNRIYGEDVSSKPGSHGGDNRRENRDGPSTMQKPVLFMTASSSSSRQKNVTFKETTASVISTGTRTSTVTSAVPTEPTLSRKVRRNSEERGSAEVSRGDAPQQFEMEQEKEGEGIVCGASPPCSSLEEERESVRLSPSSPHPSATITAWEAGWNVTNAIQGIFVLGLPFALVQSGYVGLALLVLSAWVCNHTGRILVACLYEEEQSEASGKVSKVRVRRSYEDIMEACCKGFWPNWSGVGGWMVNIAQVIELLMTCTLYLLVSTSLLSDCLSWLAVPRSACSVLSLVFLLPCLLLTDLRPVSTLSLLCSLAHIVISLLVMLYCLSRASSWSWFSLSLSVDPEDFLVSVGVIIFSYTSQIFLPPLEGSMEDRGKFNAMLGWTHGAACIMKTMFSLLAVLTWGSETREVITDNLPSDLRPLVNLCLLAKALLSYPLPFYSAAEILQSCLTRASPHASSSKPGGRGLSLAALAVRGSLLMASYLLALLVPRFSLLMGLTGSVTGAAMTLILPCVFHLRLRWRRLTVRERLVDAGILSLGVVCSVSGVICSVRRLLEGL